MPLTTQKVNSEMHAIMAILKRLKTFFLRRSQSKIRNMLDYILNMSNKRQKLLRFIITETGFPVGVIAICCKNMETCKNT